MTKDLSTAISLLNTNKINPTSEIVQGLEDRELVALWVHWSSISKDAGLNKIKSIIGNEYDLVWFPNLAEIRITMKK